METIKVSLSPGILRDLWDMQVRMSSKQLESTAWGSRWGLNMRENKTVLGEKRSGHGQNPEILYLGSEHSVILRKVS